MWRKLKATPVGPARSPLGSGEKLLGSATGAADKLVSRWGIEGITTFQAGFPIRLASAPNRSGSFGSGSRPNSTGQSARTAGPAQSRLGKWFDTSVFSPPASFTFGNVSRTLPDMRAHGTNNYDFAVFKNTEPSESATLQFRAEFFNLFNRVQFGFPGQVLGPAQFGVVSSQVNDPRLIQLVLRLNWQGSDSAAFDEWRTRASRAGGQRFRPRFSRADQS